MNRSDVVTIIIDSPAYYAGVPPQLDHFLSAETAPIELILAGDYNPAMMLPDNVQLFQDKSIARARNKAINAASGDIVCFIDVYTQPGDNWLNHLLEPLKDKEVVGVKGKFASARTEIVPRFLQLEYANRYRRLTAGQQVDLVEMFSAAYKRDVLLANGGFDERFADLAERELSYRLSVRGYKLVFAPEAIVYDTRKLGVANYTTRKAETAFWNAQVVRRFPALGIQDAQTPQTLKIQMVLAGLATLCLTLPPLWPLALFIFILFAGTTVPFVARGVRLDPIAALIAPPMLYLRSLALMIGYGWGVIRPKKEIANTETTIVGYQYLVKRGIDILGGLIGTSLLALLLPFVAILIKRDSDGPIFFRQERIGESGRAFTCYKFRTMQADAEEKLDELIDLDQLEEPAFKLENDPRITPFGRFLRRWSIDEIPQFWNVLRGDMSLVGPRPEETRIVLRYNDWQRRRLAVKPGLSGPMQINGRGSLTLNQRVKLEIEYIENYSLWRDAKILLQTFPAVFSGKGAS